MLVSVFILQSAGMHDLCGFYSAINGSKFWPAESCRGLLIVMLTNNCFLKQTGADKILQRLVL